MRVWLNFLLGSTNEFSHSYCNLFLLYCELFFSCTENYFSTALRIIFHGIVNLFFGLQYIAGLRLRGTGRVCDFLARWPF